MKKQNIITSLLSIILASLSVVGCKTIDQNPPQSTDITSESTTAESSETQASVVQDTAASTQTTEVSNESVKNETESQKFQQVEQMIQNPQKSLSPENFATFVSIFDHWQGLGLTENSFSEAENEPFGAVWECSIKQYIHSDYTVYAVIRNKTGEVVSIRIKGNDGNNEISAAMAHAIHGAMACFEVNFQLHSAERFSQLGITEEGGKTSDLKELEYESIGGVYYRSKYSPNMNCYVFKVGRIPD